MAPKQTDPQFKLRMTPEIKAAIEKAAAANNRSMNAEIVQRLEKSFDGADEIDDLYREIYKRDARIREIEEANFQKEKLLNETISHYTRLTEQQSQMMKTLCVAVLATQGATSENLGEIILRFMLPDHPPGATPPPIEEIVRRSFQELQLDLGEFIEKPARPEATKKRGTKGGDD